MAIEGDNSPLALNSLVDASGPNSYLGAIAAVDAIIHPEKHPLFAADPDLTRYVRDRLYGLITAQSQANWAQYDRIAPHLSPDHQEIVQGTRPPAELTAFLGEVEQADAIEIVRRTLANEWNAWAEVDQPALANLDQAEELDTQTVKSAPLYRIKNLDTVGNKPEALFAQIDRKQTVRQHFGGRVLTVVRDSIVLYNPRTQSAEMPRDLRNLIRDHRQLARKTDYNYDEHHDIFKEHLEPYLWDHESPEVPPLWAVRSLVTYYSVKRHAVKAEQLKELDTGIDAAAH